jgi:hypothetical protein
MIAPELSNENTSRKRTVRKNQPAWLMNNSMCHNEHKIREYCARKTMMRVLHPVDSPDLSPCNFWFSGDPKEWKIKYSRARTIWNTSWQRIKHEGILCQSTLMSQESHLWFPGVAGGHTFRYALCIRRIPLRQMGKNWSDDDQLTVSCFDVSGEIAYEAVPLGHRNLSLMHNCQPRTGRGRASPVKETPLLPLLGWRPG